MPFLDREVTLTVIDRTYGITASIQRGVKPPNGIAALADQTGIPVRTLREAVHGRDPVAEHRLVLIAAALGVKPKHLTAQPDPVPAPKPDPPKPKVEPVAPPPRRREKTGPPRKSGEAA